MLMLRDKVKVILKCKPSRRKLRLKLKHNKPRRKPRLKPKPRLMFKPSVTKLCIRKHHSYPCKAHFRRQ